MGEMENEKSSQAGQLFENFVQASTCKGTLQAFNILCRQLELDPSDHRNFYSRLKAKVTSWKAKGLWSKLDKRAAHKEYKKGKACIGNKCLIVGGGPCGLRTAIELVLLGAKVVVIEKRDTFSRNNVLHLWPYTIHDLRSLGAKKFYGKFCAGAIDHISIRQLQLMLLKIALMVGVEIHVNVEFIRLLEPPEDQENEGPGWRAEVRPADHPVADFDFDVIVGADGRRNTLEGFRRKEFRGKLAIAITANFINRNTTAEAKVEEISGVAFIFNQKFFLELKEETGIDLENIVYYKDNTHYFVMTAKKQSLLDKGVIINDYIDTEMLLSSENVNQEALLSYAREAADFGTNYQLPSLDYAMNHYGQPDVAMFDFTCMYASENAALVRERFGHRLLVALVGDSLLEPFWPMGTGCARGFLAAFDMAWMVKGWAQGRAPLEILAERESLYRLLPQTTPENITKNFEQYTIDPGTRYPNLNSTCVRPHQVRHLYITGELQPCTLERSASVRRPVNLARRESEVRPSRLLTWCQKHTEGYRSVNVCDLTSSWKSGLALCALIHSFRADLIDFDSLSEEDCAKNNQLAFDIAEREFGIPPITTGVEMVVNQGPDKLSMVMYLSKFYEMFRGTPLPAADSRRVTDENGEKPANSIYNLKNVSLPRKRIPKGDQKSEDSDSSKRRRKFSNYLEEATNFSSQNTQSACEGAEPKENKVKFMATQLLAKFEENAASGSLRRQTERDSAPATPLLPSRPPRPPSLDMTENPRFAKPAEQAPPSPLLKRQPVTHVKCGPEYVGPAPHPSSLPHIPRKPRQADQTDGGPQAGNSPRADYPDSLTSYRATVLAMSSMLQRLQRLEDQISQKKAQSQNARDFRKKSIKEKAVHLSAMFSGCPAAPSERTVGKVSLVIGAMAETLATLYENDHRPQAVCPSPLPGSLRREFPSNLGGSDTCHFCGKRVYVMERLSAEGLFFHRECFRCATCSCTLRLGGHAFDSAQGKFYCKLHFAQQKALVKQRRRTVELQKEELEARTQRDSRTPTLEGSMPHSATSSPESQPPGRYFQLLPEDPESCGAAQSPAPMRVQTQAKGAVTLLHVHRSSGPEPSDGTDVMHSSPPGGQHGHPAAEGGDAGESSSECQTQQRLRLQGTPPHCHGNQHNTQTLSKSSITDSVDSCVTPVRATSAFSQGFPSSDRWPSQASRGPLGAAGKRKLTLSLTERENLLDWDSSPPEEPDPQCECSADVHAENKEALPAFNPMSTLTKLQPQPQPQATSPHSPLQLVASALRWPFRSSTAALSTGEPRRNRSLSHSSFRWSSLFRGQTPQEESAEETGRVAQPPPAKEIPSVTPSRGPGGTDLPEMLENISLSTGLRRASRDDMVIPPPRSLNYFSSLRVKRSHGMESRASSSREKDIWSVVTQLRSKDSSRERWESSSSSCSSDDDEKPVTKQKGGLSLKASRQRQMEALQTRQEQLKRLHRAQVIQRQLEEVGERQRAVEEKGVTLEKVLRKEAGGGSSDTSQLLQTWYNLVLEKNRLVDYESELVIFAQELELEDTQSQLQQKLRRRMVVDDSRKSPEELAEEQQMFAEMMRLVEQRDALVAKLEEKRLGGNLETLVHRFHWT
ncbi:F-actin-monooxygenase MICAL2-like isoform X2 [Arapaima gigas]